jgi:hypothetical protein
MLVPEPVIFEPSGKQFSVHDPCDGRFFSTTVPVATIQVGWVIVPITGADGVTGCTVIIIFAEAREVHPRSFVIV